MISSFSIYRTTILFDGLKKTPKTSTKEVV